jgi:hypothetical protein
MTKRAARLVPAKRVEAHPALPLWADITVAQVRRHAGRPWRYPLAYASAFSPTGRRTRWMAVVKCPFCRGGELTYAKTLGGLAGLRTSACKAGRIWVVIARVVEARAVTG